jgi:CcmD family protein
MARRRLGWVACLALVVWVGIAAAAQQPDFGPITEADVERENLPATPLVYAAYAIVWLVLVGYAFTLGRRIGRVERELGDVTARIEKGRRT